MLGVEFASPKLAEDVQWACFVRGLLVLKCGKQTVRLCPPLVASAADVETAVRISARPWQMSRRTQQTWSARPQRPARSTTARWTASAIAQHAALLEAQVGRPVPDIVW